MSAVITEVDDDAEGLDEAAAGVPSPHTAAASAGGSALPTMIPKGVHPLAVLSFVLAVVAPVVAIPLAHRVGRRLQLDGSRGRSLVQASIVIGYLMCLVLALIALNVVVAVVLHP